jgi:hypothetical protein
MTMMARPGDEDDGSSRADGIMAVLRRSIAVAARCGFDGERWRRDHDAMNCHGGLSCCRELGWISGFDPLDVFMGFAELIGLNG